MTGFSNIIRNCEGLLSIEDNYKQIRIRAFYCLDDQSESENDSMFNYLMSYRDENPLAVLILLKLMGDLFSKDGLSLDYVRRYNTVILFIYI